METPIFVISDPEIIKQITIKDFEHFHNRTKSFDESVDKVIGKSLNHLRDERWRNTRISMTPIFTTSKAKFMFEALIQCSHEFVDQFDTNEKIVFDVRDVFLRYVVDAISSSALGFQSNCIKEKNNFVYEMASKLSTPTTQTNFKVLQKIFFKQFNKIVKSKIISDDFSTFFKKITVDVMDERDAKGIFRPDVVQLLLQLRKGQLSVEDTDEFENFSSYNNHEIKDSGNKVKLDQEDFMAQGLIRELKLIEKRH